MKNESGPLLGDPKKENLWLAHMLLCLRLFWRNRRKQPIATDSSLKRTSEWLATSECQVEWLTNTRLHHLAQSSSIVRIFQELSDKTVNDRSNFLLSVCKYLIFYVVSQNIHKCLLPKTHTQYISSPFPLFYRKLEVLHRLRISNVQCLNVSRWRFKDTSLRSDKARVRVLLCSLSPQLTFAI